MSDPDLHTLSIERIIGAPRAAVWRCWTESDLQTKWFCPKPWRYAEADLDVRPGGRMNGVMEGPKGERAEMIGCFLETTPERRLVFTDAFSEDFRPRPEPFMTAVVELEDAGAERRRMVRSARHADAAAKQRHLEMGFEAGWAASAAQLDALAQETAAETAAESEA